MPRRQERPIRPVVGAHARTDTALPPVPGADGCGSTPAGRCGSRSRSGPVRRGGRLARVRLLPGVSGGRVRILRGRTRLGLEAHAHEEGFLAFGA